MGGMGNMVGFYALTGPNDLWLLKEKADKIEQDFLNDDEISQIQVIGYAPIIISVEIDEASLSRYNTNFDIISTAIKTSNIDISGGSIKTLRDEIIIRSNNRNTTTAGIENIVVFSNRNGDIVRLKDIAKVSLEFSDIPMKAYVNGERAINFLIKKTPEERILELEKDISNERQLFAALKKKYPFLSSGEIIDNR